MKMHVYLNSTTSRYWHPLTKWRVSYLPEDTHPMPSNGFPTWREAMDAAQEIIAGVAA